MAASAVSRTDSTVAAVAMAMAMLTAAASANQMI